MMADPDHIYLEPECCADPGTGRLWCEDNLFAGDCDDDKPGTEYVRADLAVKAATDAIVAWLREDAHQMKVAACVAQDRVLPHETIADAIERGDHLPGGGE